MKNIRNRLSFSIYILVDLVAKKNLFFGLKDSLCIPALQLGVTRYSAQFKS